MPQRNATIQVYGIFIQLRTELNAAMAPITNETMELLLCRCCF